MSLAKQGLKETVRRMALIIKAQKKTKEELEKEKEKPKTKQTE